MGGIQNPSSTFTGSETAANLNSANAKTVTVKAKWKSNCTGDCSEIDVAVNGYVDYTYTGSVKGVTLKKAGYYKLEVWGAQGGYTYSSNNAGYGGYSLGTVQKSAGDILFVVVGQYGRRADNGGGTGPAYNGGGKVSNAGITGKEKRPHASGGGATHIATASGVLSSLSSSSNQAKVLIVAGGGGGEGDSATSTYAGKETGGNGGGYQASSGGSYDDYPIASSSATNRGGGGGNQSSGGARALGHEGCMQNGDIGVIANSSFGLGGYRIQLNNTNETDYNYGAGGGGGWFGGGLGSCDGGGGGGSGYIGNSLLLSAKGVTKQMYMHSTGCAASTAAATKTTCTTSTGAHVANAANTGNGYARITYLGT